MPSMMMVQRSMTIGRSDWEARISRDARIKVEMDMERKRVKSSNLISVGYEAATRRLEIEFKDGSVYAYADVPKAVHTALMKAKSLGGFLFKKIKGVYEATKVDAD